MDNVIPITKKQHNHRPQLQTILKTADTGTRPFLAEATDGHIYWCKQYHNDHGYTATINEIVGCVIGNELGAPILDWAILDVPTELRNTYTPTSKQGNRVIINGIPVFGTRQIHASIQTDQLRYVEKDSNYNRIPLLTALWILCNAQDIQLLFDASNDYSTYSLDHGLWFGSDEVPWELAPYTTRYGQTSVPQPPRPIPSIHWEEAIQKVTALDHNLIDKATLAIPPEWSADYSDIKKLVKYALSRKSYTIKKLRMKTDDPHGGDH